MPQPCIQQTAFKMHQPTADTQQIFLSLRFRSPKARSRVYERTTQQNYHVVLLSIFILAFFLILELTPPAAAQLPHTATSQEEQPPPAPFTHDWVVVTNVAPGASYGLSSVDEALD